jgi:hypothetical protein
VLLATTTKVRPVDARDAYKRLLAAQKHVLGPSHLLLATTTKVRPVDARDAYKRLLAAQKHVLGPSHLLLATTTKVREGPTGHRAHPLPRCVCVCVRVCVCRSTRMLVSGPGKRASASVWCV